MQSRRLTARIYGLMACIASPSATTEAKRTLMCFSALTSGLPNPNIGAFTGNRCCRQRGLVRRVGAQARSWPGVDGEAVPETHPLSIPARIPTSTQSPAADPPTEATGPTPCSAQQRPVMDVRTGYTESDQVRRWTPRLRGNLVAHRYQRTETRYVRAIAQLAPRTLG